MRRLKFWFPVVLYSGIIFYISSLSSQKIAFTHVIWDKFLHTLEYALLGFLCARALWNSSMQKVWAIWIVSALGCYMYGLSDEVHQSFVPGRDCSIWDACADLLGATLGSGIYLIIKQLFQVKKEVTAHVSA